jgi:hypothetical protein
VVRRLGQDAADDIGQHRRAEIRLYRALVRTGADPVTESFTVRSRISRARSALRRSLGDTNPAAFVEERKP